MNATGIETSMFESVPYSRSADANQPTNFVKRGAFFSERYGRFNVPTQRMVVGGVFPAPHNLEIGNPVVKPVAIDMMDHLEIEKFSSNGSFHNKAMLKIPFPFKFEYSVPLAAYHPSSLEIIMADFATEEFTVFAPIDMVGCPIESFATSSASANKTVTMRYPSALNGAKDIPTLAGGDTPGAFIYDFPTGNTKVVGTRLPASVEASLGTIKVPIWTIFDFAEELFKAIPAMSANDIGFCCPTGVGTKKDSALTAFNYTWLLIDNFSACGTSNFWHGITSSNIVLVGGEEADTSLPSVRLTYQNLRRTSSYIMDGT